MTTASRPQLSRCGVYAEQHCRSTSGLMPLKQWKAEVANRLARA